MTPCAVCGVPDTSYVCREIGEFVNLCEACWPVWHAGDETEQQARFEVFRALHALRK